jgi:hypothetical protein
MRRREFIAGLGSAAVWPVAVGAQQPAMPVIGYLDIGVAETRRDQLIAFRRGLNEAGFVEGRNVTVEFRWADSQYERMPALTDDLLRRRVAVVFAFGAPAVQAAKARTATVPIVFCRRRRAGISPRPVAGHGSMQDQGADLRRRDIRSDALAATRRTSSTVQHRGHESQ